MIGELFAGVILGPSVLGWIEPFEAIKLMAEIGIILLLFEVGLGTDAKRLVRTGAKSLVVALSGFALLLVLGFALGYWVFGLSLVVSPFIGGTLTVTSIGITIRVLADLKRQHVPEEQIVLGAAVKIGMMNLTYNMRRLEFLLRPQIRPMHGLSRLRRTGSTQNWVYSAKSCRKTMTSAL